MRRRKRKGEDSGFNVWRGYSDMMCGLFLLFVLIMCVTLYQAQKSYNDSLEEEAARLALLEQYTDSQDTVSAQATTIEDQEAELALYKSALETQESELNDLRAELEAKESELNVQAATLSAQQSDLDEKTSLLATQQAQIDNIIGVKADVISALTEEFAANNVSVDIDSQTGALTLASSVMFDYNESVLTTEGRRILKEVLPIYCEVLLKEEYADYVAEIIIDGYTDTSGDYAYNLQLSQARSYAVAEYLLALQTNFLTEEQQSTLEELLSVNGHSMSNPILDADGNVNMDASRRVEIKFRLKDEEMLEELSALLGTVTETSETTESETTAAAESETAAE